MTILLAVILSLTHIGPLSSSACSLITTAELEKITGKNLADQKPYLYNFPGGGSSCTYASAQIQLVVFSGVGSGKKYDDYVRSNYAKMVKNGAPDMTKHPVSGVGSSAYFMSPRVPSAILVVSKGIHTLAISLVASNGKPESVKPTLIAIAKIASARLGLL